ncbi:MAG: hypothetical protein IT373_27385 [Polyangiaceae bacterium]|nr:hypothetical protein [Polyangiaceae bacterium]
MCVQKATEQLVCAGSAVCRALWDLGAKSVCRYADKSAYDNQALPVPTGPCPGGTIFQRLCGGACGACDPVYEVCTGRSPLHPFGFCAPAGLSGAAAPCALAPGGGMALPCAFPDDYCGIFEVPVADAPAAAAYGICLSQPGCTHLAAVLPGGIRCFDQAGHEVGP